jgi:hypothetical protein
MDINYKIDNAIEDMAMESAQWAQAYAMLRVATELGSLSIQVKYLGNGNASTQMGAIEAFGLAMKESISELATTISDATGELTGAVGDVTVALTEAKDD